MSAELEGNVRLSISFLLVPVFRSGFARLGYLTAGEERKRQPIG